MKNLKITILLMMFTIASFSQININLIDSIYVHPQNLGQYPNATLEYVGEVHDSYNESFNFKFYLKTQNNEVISKHNWSVSGETIVPNLIKNHGLLDVVVVNDTIQFGFPEYVIAGHDLNEPSLRVLEHPQLSYDDIVSYFILGGKLDKVQLPAGNVARTLIEWMLLNQLNINGEMAVNQFEF